MKRTVQLAALLLAIGLLLSCGGVEPAPQSSTTLQTTVPPTTEETEPQPGWHNQDDLRYYIKEDGTYATGWLDTETGRYYFDSYGVMRTGWLKEDGHTYYLKEDGSMARGEIIIDGLRYHFASNGQRIILVNPWNSVPAYYEPDLVTLSTDISTRNIKVDSSCYADLLQMIADCNAQCPSVCVVSGYRTRDYQTGLHQRKIRAFEQQGYSREDAQAAAAMVVAIPGTSEHELGLAVDIIDTRQWSLTENQANLPAQQWLMANSWRYGFILRYPEGKSDSTGIIYEPWHYRYLGREIAKEVFESGLTLEEYLAQLQ